MLVYQSGFNQKIRTSERYILEIYYKELAFMIVSSVKASLKSIEQAVRKGRLELLGADEAAVRKWNFFFFREASALPSSPFR